LNERKSLLCSSLIFFLHRIKLFRDNHVIADISIFATAGWPQYHPGLPDTVARSAVRCFSYTLHQI